VNTIPVSVIIASFNSEIYLEKCINSINQSKQIPVQIIIVDDCSTDNSLELSKKLRNTHPNICIFEMKKNSGAAEARKYALKYVTQNYVCYVDSDDILEINALDDAYKKIIKENADVCIFDLWRFDNNKEWRHKANPTNFPITGREAVNMTFGGWGIHMCSIVKKRIFKQAYENFSLKTFNADEMIARLIYSHSKKVTNSKKKYFYRVNQFSTTHLANKKQLEIIYSDLWLIKFSSTYSKLAYLKTIRWSIKNLYLIWKKRKLINKELTNKEIKKGLKEIYKIKNIWLYFIKSPKHLIASVLLYIAILLRI
tara:strand:- start:301 stop:1233 length:933 start_codon:yes stop_codon:yes gene_type:complete